MSSRGPWHVRHSILAVLVLAFSASCNPFTKDKDKEEETGDPVIPGPVTANFQGDYLGWTGSDDASRSFTMVRINGSTGTVSTIGGDNFFTDLSYGPDGTLYGVASDLHIINPLNGSTHFVGDFVFAGSSTAILMTAAAFGLDGQFYVLENASTRRVWRVNLSDASLTLVGAPTATVRAIDFNPSDGILYGGFQTLYRLNSTNMSTLSTVGAFGATLGAITFSAGATLRGTNAFPSTNVYSISLTSGAAAPLLTLNSSGIVGFVAGKNVVAPSVPALLTLPRQQRAPSRERMLEQERQLREARSRR